jgi:hypothetical protein
LAGEQDRPPTTRRLPRGHLRSLQVQLARHTAERDRCFHEMEGRKSLRPSGTRRGEIDTLSGLGAAHLARRIQAYWAAVGF